MRNIYFILGAVMLMAAANVCGCGACKANATVKTTRQFLLISKEDPKSVTLKITGMSCAGCSNHIHTALSKTEGLISNDVKYPGDIATVKYDAAKISEKEIIAVIEKAGYKAEIVRDKNQKTVSVTETKPCCSKG